jgi:hypothetical protein
MHAHQKRRLRTNWDGSLLTSQPGCTEYSLFAVQVSVLEGLVMMFQAFSQVSDLLYHADN